MTTKIFEISFYSEILSSVVLAIFSLMYCWRQFNPGYLRSFPIYTLVNAGENLASLAIRWSILPLQNVYILFEMTYCSYFLGKIIVKKKARYFIWLSAACFTVFYHFLNFRKEAMKDSQLLVVIESFLLCINCLLYFREMMMQPQLINLARTPAFWMTMGILFYFSLLIPTIFFSAYFYFKRDYARSITVYSINNYVQVINTVLFIKGMTCLRKPSS